MALAEQETSTQEVEKISTLTKKTVLISSLLILTTISTSAQLDFDNRNTFNSDNYFVMPEFDNQQEIATELVAPFLFVSILLHFALSRALSFILANNEDDPINDPRVLWGLPRGTYTTENRVDVSKYSMIMSIAITASLIPTPYWNLIVAMMASIGTLTVLALTILFLYGFYNVAKALT